MNWRYTVKIKHLMTDKEDWESVQTEMTAIADILKAAPCFALFDVTKFYAIPKGDDAFGPTDYVNKLLERVYDYADYHSIWID